MGVQLVFQKGVYTLLIFLSLLFPLTVVSVILIAAYNMFIRKKTVQNHYTPFDYIAGQTSKEFHAEKKEQDGREDDDSGEGK